MLTHPGLSGINNINLNINAPLPSLEEWIQQIAESLGLKIPFNLIPLKGDASLRKYYLLLPAKLIVMDSPSNCGLAEFIALSESLLLAGLNVPKILARITNQERGYLLLTHLGDQQLSDLVNETTFYQLYPVCWQPLLLLNNYKSLAINLPFMDKSYIELNLEVFKKWYLEGYLQLDTFKLDNLIEEISELFISVFNSQPQVIVHADYHCRNLVFHNEQLGILDFQDARIGPFSYDIVSLLQDAYLSWPIATVEKLYLDYCKEAANIDMLKNHSTSQLLEWFYLTGIQRHLKNLGVFVRLKELHKKHYYMDYIPNLLNYIKIGVEKTKIPVLLHLQKVLL